MYILVGDVCQSPPRNAEDARLAVYDKIRNVFH